MSAIDGAKEAMTSFGSECQWDRAIEGGRSGGKGQKIGEGKGKGKGKGTKKKCYVKNENFTWISCTPVII